MSWDYNKIYLEPNNNLGESENTIATTVYGTPINDRLVISNYNPSQFNSFSSEDNNIYRSIGDNSKCTLLDYTITLKSEKNLVESSIDGYISNIIEIMGIKNISFEVKGMIVNSEIFGQSEFSLERLYEKQGVEDKIKKILMYLYIGEGTYNIVYTNPDNKFLKSFAINTFIMRDLNINENDTVNNYEFSFSLSPVLNKVTYKDFLIT